MKIIKNDSRNALKNEKFTHLMLCAVEWGQMKNRRVKVNCDK